MKKGSSVSIKCRASGNPKPQVTWSKLNEMEVMGSGEIMELSQVKRLEECGVRGNEGVMQVTRHHEGVYQCSASNGVGSKASAKINLRVLRELKFR